MPNPSRKPTRYGRHCEPGLSQWSYRLRPGLQCLPARAASLERCAASSSADLFPNPAMGTKFVLGNASRDRVASTAAGFNAVGWTELPLTTCQQGHEGWPR